MWNYLKLPDISGNKAEIYPLIQVILTVVKLLRMCLPHELYVDLRVEFPTVSKLQLKHTHFKISFSFKTKWKKKIYSM